MNHGGRRGAGGPESGKPPKSQIEQMKNVWPELKEMILPRRKIIFLGFLLMIVNRISGLVLPVSTKFLIDDVIGKKQADLLTYLVLGILGATLIQGVTSFALTQLLSKAGSRNCARRCSATSACYRSRTTTRTRAARWSRAL